MVLPQEVLSAIADILKRRPSNDLPVIVSEVLETFAGQDPNKLLALFKSAGGPAEFVQAVDAETRRLKSLSSNKK